MEPASLALAVPSIIALAIQSFRHILAIHRATMNAEKRLSDIMRNIIAAEQKFCIIIEKVLTGITDNDKLKQLMETPSVKNWSQHPFLEDGLRTTLGHRYSLFGHHVNNIRCLLEEFMSEMPHELKLTEKAVKFKATLRPLLPSEILANAGYVAASTGNPPFVTHKGSIPWSKKLKWVMDNKIEKLESIHEQFKSENSELYMMCVLHFLPDSGTRSMSKSKSTASTSNPSRLLAKQNASRHLYQSLTTHHHCSYHSLYLSLETHSSKIDASSSTVSYIVSFSLLLSSPQEPILLQLVTPPPDSGTAATHISQGKCLSLATIPPSLPPDDLIMNTFVIKPIRCTQQPNVPVGVALHELCRWDHQKFNPENRLHVAARLGRAALDFHESPWFPLWKTTSIWFFQELEQLQNPASWTPYLHPTFDTNKLNTTDSLDDFVRMLIELGGVDLSMYDIMQADGGISKGLRVLSSFAGIKYKQVVEECFNVQFRSLEDSKNAVFEALNQIAGLESIAKEWFGGTEE